MKIWQKLWYENGDTNAYSNWKNCKKEFRRIQRQEAYAVNRQHSEKINQLFWWDKTKFWKHINTLKKTQSTCQSTADIDFTSYYKVLFSNEDLQNSDFHTEISNAVKDRISLLKNEKFSSKVNALDIKAAINNLSTGKAIGYDNTCSEMFLYGDKSALIPVLTLFFDIIMRFGTVPNEMNVSLITPIPKTKDFSNNPSDYRPISVSTTIALILEDIILQKVNLKVCNNQFGFRPKTSTKHTYFVVNETLLFYKENGSSCWIASLDANKAFDKLWRTGLYFKAINKIPNYIWRVLVNYYSTSKGVVKTNGKLSDKFVIEEGVKQGGKVSPLLFDFFIDDLLSECLKMGLGAHINGINVSVIAYADDVLLISPVASHLQILLNKCEEYSIKWKMKFNPKKSLIYNTDKINGAFTLMGERMKEVDGFIYLGLPVGDKKFIEKYWEDKFRNVERSFYAIRNLGLHKDFMNPMCLGFIFKQFCQSTFVYGLELVNISRQQLKNFDTRLGILFKSCFYLSKFSRTKPLLNALKVDTFTHLYFKFKILFNKQVTQNQLVMEIFKDLSIFYQNNTVAKLSYFRQRKDTEKILQCDLDRENKKDLFTKLISKFHCHNEGLIDSLTYLIHNFNNFPDAFAILRNLLWVEFEANP